MNLPDVPTICCRLLKSRSTCVDIKRVRKLPQNEIWYNILRDKNINIDKLGYNEIFACSNCMKYLRDSKMPPQCYLNNLFVADKVEALDDLTDWELLLVKRAHAF